MSDRTFLDTNVLVYGFDAAEPTKKARALDILSGAADTGGFVVSTQVLNEFYVVVTRKLDVPLPAADAERAVHKLSALPVVPADRRLVHAAIATSRRHQLSLWDSLILQAAIVGGCSRVLSEDMQDGFRLHSVTVENPFRDVS